MSSGPVSLLSELDLCICANGGMGKLASSSASSDKAVLTLRQSLEDHVVKHGDKPLDQTFIGSIPVDLPRLVPKSLQATLSPSSMKKNLQDERFECSKSLEQEGSNVET